MVDVIITKRITVPIAATPKPSALRCVQCGCSLSGRRCTVVKAVAMQPTTASRRVSRRERVKASLSAQ
jgi:hypothetical protein